MWKSTLIQNWFPWHFCSNSAETKTSTSFAWPTCSLIVDLMEEFWDWRTLHPLDEELWEGYVRGDVSTDKRLVKGKNMSFLWENMELKNFIPKKGNLLHTDSVFHQKCKIATMWSCCPGADWPFNRLKDFDFDWEWHFIIGKLLICKSAFMRLTCHVQYSQGRLTSANVTNRPATHIDFISKLYTDFLPSKSGKIQIFLWNA